MSPKFRNIPKPETVANPLATHAQTKFQQALALHQNGQLAQAQVLYEDLLRTQPQHFDALHLSGVIAAQTKNHRRAVELIGKAIELNPDNAAFYSNRGNALKELKLLDAAVESYSRAIAIKPDYAEAYSNRGLALAELKQLDAAVESFNKAIAIKPDYAKAYFNRGAALAELKQLNAAVASYDKAIAIKPDYAEAYWNKSLALLLGGDFVNGLELHEWRWKIDTFTYPKRNFPQPRWLGKESIAGKSILLHSEQGFGDTIQFCRYANLVSDLGARVIMEVETSLVGLLKELAGVSDLVVKSSPLPAFDYHCPLSSLPLAFKTDVNCIPSAPKYLSADTKKMTHWANRLGEKTKQRVGLVWSGNAEHKNDHNRSIILSELIQQLPPDYQYVSLQDKVRDIDKSTLESRANILHFGGDLKDFTDTAALCELMDVVISVDTSVAHLGGALGKPTWVLLPFSPDWRWLLDRDDSPWYPSVKLYRQPSIGDWGSVFAKVKGDLAQFKS